MGFKRFDPEDFVVSSDTVTSTVWSNNAVELSTFHTSSTQTQGSSGEYYINAYQTASDDASAAVQFAIAYADLKGSGSLLFDQNVEGKSPSRSIYGQYRTLLLEDENAEFTFGDTISSSYFYIISPDRARYKEKLLPGSFNLKLTGSRGGAGVTLHLTDNSNDVTLPTFYGAQRAYQIISGSNGTAYDGAVPATGYTPSSGSYGLFFPDTSTILLNGKALDGSTVASQGISLGTGRNSNTNDNNSEKLYDAISGSLSTVFKLNSQETITSDYVFVRTRNSEFNYTENPSFISGSTGEVVYNYFIDNPQVYATTVGMYNDSNELLAVAKLSKPLVKDFTKESLVRVKLDF